MRYIDITTSHNISIRYELASVMHRILAWGIDYLILMLWAFLVSIPASGSTVLYYILFFFVFIFYDLAFEILNNGQTIGKKILNIKVVTLHGRTAKAQDYFLRWIFRILEIGSTFGILAIIYISSTEKHQRIGDLIAQTTVIKLRPDTFYNLDSLINLDKKKHTVTYPKVAMYDDTDLMLVKDTLKRYKSNPNDANKKFLLTLTKRFAKDLDIILEGKKASALLETILVDYISLTR